MPVIHDALDSLIRAEIVADGPGAVVGVLHQGELIHAVGYGYANLEWHTPIATDTVFRLASITKTLTACAVLRLIETGTLALHDPVTRFLPDYPTSGHDLTVYHLLTHTAGISNERAEDRLYGRHDLNPHKMMAHFSQRPFEFKPGTRYRYTNTGYVLLGLIIEAASGMRYAEFMAQEVFAPLGMESACFFHERPIIPRRAQGYSRNRRDGGWQHARFFSADISYAGGGLGMSLDDLLRWVRAFQAREWLAAASWEAMCTPGVLDDGSPTRYGLGIAIKAYRGRRLYGHAGTTPGFHNRMAILPDDDLAVVVLSNQADFDTDKLTAAIIRVALEIETSKPRPYIVTGDGLSKCMGEWSSDGHPLRFIREDNTLVLRGSRSVRLLASGRDTFFAPDNPDVQVTFSAEQNGVYMQMQVQTAFREFTAHRVDQNGAAPDKM